MRRISVRLQLTLWNVGALAFILLALGAALRLTLEETLTRSIDSTLTKIGTTYQQIADSDPDFPFFGDHHDGPPPDDHHGPPPPDGGGGPPPPPPNSNDRNHRDDHRDHGQPPNTWRLGRRLFGSLNAYSAMLFDPQGNAIGPGPDRSLFDRRAFARGLRGATVFTEATVSGQISRVITVPLHRSGRVIAVIQARRSLVDIRAQLRALSRVLWILAPFALLVAGLGGAFLTNRALRPVRSMAYAAESVGAKSLSERLPVVGGGEFAQLAVAFNAMLGRIEAAFRDLEEANERQRRFVADASHELRTPVSIIKANTSLALMMERTPEEYRKALRAADGAADRTAKIVQDLLLLARADADQLDYPLEPTDIDSVIQRASGVIHGDPVPKLTLNLPTPPPLVMGNSETLIRLFSNLLDNSLRHTPPEGAIAVIASVNGDRISVVVADTGEGIAPEHIPHLQERFYRVDTARSRARGGTGLGLAICDTIVQAHHGAMTITSEVGKGTQVTVWLPLAA